MHSYARVGTRAVAPVLFALALAAGCASKGDPCAELDCSGTGVCRSEDAPRCDCNEGYHAEGLSCVLDGEMGPCATQDCSGHGECVIRDDSTTCVCDEGFISQGVECIPAACEAIDCGPNGTCVATDDLATCTCDEGYELADSECVVACRPWAGAPSLEIRTVAVDGAVTIAGEAPTAPVQLTLVDADDYSFGLTYDPSDDTWNGGAQLRVVPGAYRLFYNFVDSGPAEAPMNRRLPLAELQLDVDGAASLDVDIPVATITGTLTVNGETPTAGVQLLFVNEEDTADLAGPFVIEGVLTASDGTTAVPIAPGRYSVFYRIPSSGIQVGRPINRRYLLGTLECTTAPRSLMICPSSMYTPCSPSMANHWALRLCGTPCFASKGWGPRISSCFRFERVVCCPMHRSRLATTASPTNRARHSSTRPLPTLALGTIAGTSVKCRSSKMGISSSTSLA